MATKKKQKDGIRWGRLILTALLVLALVGGIAAVVIVTRAAQDLPDFDPAQLAGDNSSLIYDDSDRVVSRLHGGENRTEVTYDNIPPDLVHAFIAIEDQGFEKHHGISVKGIARALVYNVINRDMTGQGASTITQQLARNAFLDAGKRWERKIKEMLLAFKIESVYSKEEIMTMYVNLIFFGERDQVNCYGIEAAANTFFGKSASQLSLSECAMLAGKAQRPNYFDLEDNYDACRNRQKLVLDNMVEMEFITQAEADAAWEDAPVLSTATATATFSRQYGYYIDAVIEEALTTLRLLPGYEEDAESLLYRGGLKLYTNMDEGVQSFVETYISDPASFPDQSTGDQEIQAAFTLIDHSNGAVKALIGGREYTTQRGFNRATDAHRMPGSTIKPLTVYSAALELGVMPYQVFDDSPLNYEIHGEAWQPANYDDSYRGIITMRTAVQYSVNTFAIQTLDYIGIRNAYNMGKALGLTLVETGPSNDLSLSPLSLGSLTVGTNPLEMANAYGVIANTGIYNKPYLVRRITDANDKVIYEHSAYPNRVMRQDTAWLMTNMLESVTAAGTGTRAKVAGVPTAGKTGTSEEYRDSWFCGFTPHYAAAIWMGYDEDHTMIKAYGGEYPARMFRAVMTKAHENETAGAFVMPGNITTVRVCCKSGKLPSDICPEECIIEEYTLANAVLTETCDAHQVVSVCPDSGLLSTRYCPGPVNIAKVKAKPDSVDAERIPADSCDLHTGFSVPGLFQQLFPPDNDNTATPESRYH